MQIYQQPRKRQIYKPLSKICPTPAVDGWGRSTYRQSFKQPEPQLKNCKRTAVPTEGIWPRHDGRSEQLDRLTVHRASFREWPDVDRTLPAVICDHELVGGTHEQMQNVTSQRHDFVTKCLSEADRQPAAGPRETIGTYCGTGTCCTMTSNTTTGDAFMTPWSDGRRPLARPSTAVWSQGPNLQMAKETETSSSYQNWSPMALYRPRSLPPYCRSEEPVNGRTVYTISYRPPGTFRDPLPGEQPPTDGYGNDDKSANDPKTCKTFYPRAHDYNL